VQLHNKVRQNYTLQYLIAVCLFCTVFSFASLSQAEEQNINDIRFPIENWDAHLLGLIDKGPTLLEDNDAFMPKPYPANDSEETRKELDYLVELSKTKRDPKTIEFILNENDVFFAVDSFVEGGVLTMNLNEGLNKGLWKALEIVDQELDFFLMKYKKHYSRARPSQLRPELTLVIDNPHHAAYPSGHAAQSYSIATIMSMVDPENEAIYKDFAKSIAHRREIAGVHYPSDSKAGQNLAINVIDKLMEFPEFQAALEKAKETFVRAPSLKDYKMQMTNVNFEGHN